MIEFSLIIPHYNDSLNLIRLLDSIYLSGIKNYEIIIVDDNSTMAALEIISNFVKKYHFVKLICLEVNKGAGAARNIGMKSAVGEWLIFADSDDVFLPNTLNELNMHDYQGCDIVYFKPKSFDYVLNSESDRHIFYCLLIDRYLSNSCYLLRYKFSVPWSKMIKRVFVLENKIEFEEISASNDLMFSLKAGVLAKQINAVDSSFYCVTKRAGSLTNLRSKSIFDSRFHALVRYNVFLKKNKLSKYQEPMFKLIAKSYEFGFLNFIKCLSISFFFMIRILPIDTYLIVSRKVKRILCG